MSSTQPTEIQIAWAAGIIEGEGCISLLRSEGARRNYVSLQVNMTDEDVVEKLYNIFKVGTFAPWHPPSHKNTGRKPQFRWRVSGRPAEEVLWRIAPHLGKRRLAKFAEVLAKSTGEQVSI